MNLRFLYILVILLATACQQKPAANSTETATPGTSETPETTTLADGTYCFIQSVARDTTNINLIINGNDISGDMNWIPYEKDGARGTLVGTRSGNEIKAVWSYTIEGSNQTEEVMFKVEGDQLLRKVGELEDSNYDGNLKMKNPEAALYSETFTKVDCL